MSDAVLRDTLESIVQLARAGTHTAAELAGLAAVGLGRLGRILGGTAPAPCPFCAMAMKVTALEDGGFALEHPSWPDSSSLACVIARVGKPLAYAGSREAVAYSWNKRSWP